MLPLKFFDNIFSFDVLGLKKTSKFYLFHKCQNQNLHFEYFLKIPSEMNSKHPFYPILISNTYENFLNMFNKYFKDIKQAK